MIMHALRTFWLWLTKDPDEPVASRSVVEPVIDASSFLQYLTDEITKGQLNGDVAAAIASVSSVAASTPIPTTAAPAASQEAEPMSLLSVASSLVAKLQAVAALLPLLTSLVQTVEATLPAGTAGSTKLKAVEDALASVYEKEQIAQTSFSEVWPLLSGVASTLVATFKATGAFTSSTSSTSTTKS